MAGALIVGGLAAIPAQAAVLAADGINLTLAGSGLSEVANAAGTDTAYATAGATTVVISESADLIANSLYNIHVSTAASAAAITVANSLTISAQAATVTAGAASALTLTDDTDGATSAFLGNLGADVATGKALLVVPDAGTDDTGSKITFSVTTVASTTYNIYADTTPADSFTADSIIIGKIITYATATVSTTAAAVSPVRVTYNAAGTVMDKVPYAAVTLTQSGAAFAFPASGGVLVSLTSAPSSAALLAVSALQANTTAGANLTPATDVRQNAKLGTPARLVTTNSTVAAAAASVITFFVAADTAGRYAGTISYTDLSGDTLSSTFAFVTTGAVATVTPSITTAISPASGNTTITVTAKDAAANVTQIGVFDTVAVADGTSNGSPDVASLTDLLLFDGTADVVYTAATTASTASTVTFTPGGTMGALTATTTTVTTDSTVISGTAMPAQVAGVANNTGFAVTLPTGVTDVDADADVDINDISAAIPVGTSKVTMTFLMGAASTTYRFKGVASAGTLNGGATATAFVNATTPATAPFLATVTIDLAGNAVLAGTTLTMTQVTVVDVGVAGLSAVLTQTAPALAAAGITQSPSGAMIAALGASTPVVVTVKDQFARALGAGHTVRLFRGATVAGGTLISSAVTAADGTATVTATNLSTLATGTAEAYSFQVVPTIGAAESDDNQLTITYSTAGTITGLSVAITGTTGATTPLVAAVGTTAATTATIYPSILVPGTDGIADDAGGNSVYTVSTAAVTGNDPSAEVMTLTTTTTPANTSTYTGSEGIKFFTTAPTATTLNTAGLATATVADATAVFVIGTKTGLATVTVTSGGLTRTVTVNIANGVLDAYNISVSAPTAAIAGGAYATVTATVKDMFGNVVDTGAADLALTAEGSILLGGMAASSTTGTGAAGTAVITYLGNAAGGAGTLTIASGNTNGAWATAYVAPTGGIAPVKSVVTAVTVTAATSSTDTANVAIKADVATANAAVKALATQVTVLQASVATLIDSLTTQIAALLQSVSALTKAVAKLQAAKKK